MKVLIYLGEKEDFYGYKPTKFDLVKDTKIRLKSDELATVVDTFK